MISLLAGQLGVAILATMDLNLVKAFVCVVEGQSFTEAGKLLGLPKSSVSRRVSELEDELGVRLLHRTTRKLTLTDAGRAYFEQAERALHGLDAAAEAASGLDREPRGVVRMVVPVELGVMTISDYLAEFTRRYPEINVELSLDSRAVNLAEEGFDIGIQTRRSIDASVVARRLGSIDAGMFASVEYVERRGAPQSLDDLARHDCILLRPQQQKALWKLEHLDGTTSTVEVHGRVSTDETLFVWQAVRSGLGIGILPLHAVSACTEAGKIPPLVRALPEYAVRGAELQVVTPGGSKRPHRVTLLRDFLIESLSSRCRAHGA
jgi:DNA-binding transcriptional LysR family regulator